MTYPSKTGEPTFNLPSLPSGLSWNTSVTATQIAISISGILPVEWLDFQAIRQENSIRLDWETASETNNRGFFVERLAEQNLDWEEIGFAAGQGTTNMGGSYSFLDEKPLPGMNYYRIRQTDFDGKETYSPVIAVNFEKKGSVLWLYPNPASEVIHLSLPEGAFQLEVFDGKGKMVLSQALDSEQCTLNVNDLNAGLYLLRLKTEGGWTSGRFVKK